MKPADGPVRGGPRRPGDPAVANDGSAPALRRSDVAGAGPAIGQPPHLFGIVRAAAAAPFGAPEAIGAHAVRVVIPADPSASSRRRALALSTDLATTSRARLGAPAGDVVAD